MSKIRLFQFVLLLILTYFLINYLSTTFLNTQKLLYDTLIEQLSHERVLQLLDKQQKIQFLGYVLIPVVLFVKWILISLTLTIGEVFSNIELTFRKAIRVVLLSEPIFMIMNIVKFLWLWLFVDQLTLEYMQFFVPLSFINIFDPGEIYPWFIYPLQTFNIFELGYIYLLTYHLNKFTGCGKDKAFNFVLSTYGIGLIIWIVLVGFISLNFSA